MRRTKADLVRGWLEKARRDLHTAVNQLNAAEPFADIVCFHAQQAVEKYLKAYLVWQEIEFPRTHALEDLVLLASQKEPDFLGLQEEAASLTPYAVETRYPEFEEPLLEDARESIEIAKKVAHFVLQRLPQEARGGSDAGSIMGF
jgi:HEPN domain-containing protein